MLKTETKEQIGKYYKTALTLADIAFEHTKQAAKRLAPSTGNRTCIHRYTVPKALSD
jgi:hypothetical protein